MTCPSFLAPFAPSMQIRRVLCAALIVALAPAARAAAEEASAGASPWKSGGHGAVRLIASGLTSNEQGTPSLRAGIEIKMAPGWKTYWRYPGDSGVPLRADFSASRNVASVTVLWPAPQRFSDGGGGMAIGYPRDIVLPLHVRAIDASAPAILRGRIDYAVCKDLCVPLEADVELQLPRGPTAFEAVLAAGEARVPRRVALGVAAPLGIAAVTRKSEPHAHVVVDVMPPPGASGEVDLFVEGPDAHWSLPLPVPAPDAPAGLRRFAFDLDGMPADTDPRGAMLTFTAVSPTAAVEVSARLD